MGYYLRCHLASGEGIVTLGVSPRARVCVRRAATARGIGLGGEVNALHPMLSFCLCQYQRCIELPQY